MDTIFAVSSGAAPAAISVLRISGTRAAEAASRLCGALPSPRRASVRTLRDGVGAVLDRAIVLSFPAPSTATGEDIVELHLHGGRATVHAVEKALAAVPGLRPAEPGEFTRRALFHGRIDLTEAEGLGDLLSAETEAQRRAALHMAEGGLRHQIEVWNDRLLGLAAEVEAALDFSDEDDVPASVTSEVTASLDALSQEIDNLLETPPVERLHDGIRVVIAGPPNSGKSSLINRLAGRDVAIVSPIAGTTRDKIEAPVTRGGVAYVLTDTAGLRDNTGDAVEQIGIDRARASIDSCDILVWLDDEPPIMDDAAIWLHARCDADGREVKPSGPALAISARTGEGIKQLWDILSTRASAMSPQPDRLAVNARQRALLKDASVEAHAVSCQRDMLLVGEAIRRIRSIFDAITGRSDLEAVLDTLFARFCIGK